MKFSSLKDCARRGIAGVLLTVALVLAATPVSSAAGNKWLVPVGGGIGKILAIGKQKSNVQVTTFWVPIQSG